MKRGIFFTIEAVLVLGVLALLLYGQAVVYQSPQNIHLTTNTINTATTTYLDNNVYLEVKENYYCQKAIIYDPLVRIYKEKLVCGGFN